MVKSSKKMMNFVVIGRPNPQILNVDFLKKYDIIPVNEEPFSRFAANDKQFTKFISTPIMATIAFDNIEFVVDEGRFQIVHYGIESWDQTPITGIAKKYFETLKFTPVKLAGFNLRVGAIFGDTESAKRFQKLCLPRESAIIKAVAQEVATADVVVRYPYPNSDEQVMLSINQPKTSETEWIINLNYEFKFVNWDDFNEHLDKVPDIGSYFDSLINQLLEQMHE